jgi:transcription initiation factor IIE alpha subunit
MSVFLDSQCDLPLFTQRAPSVNGSATSAAAADSLDSGTLNRLHKAVLAYIAGRGDGCTDEEIARALGMNPSTARPRRIELARRGLVVEAGTRKTASGRNASVWRIA